MTVGVHEVIMSEAVARGFSLFNPCRNLGLGRSVMKEKRVITRDEEAANFAKLRWGGARITHRWPMRFWWRCAKGAAREKWRFRFPVSTRNGWW